MSGDGDIPDDLALSDEECLRFGEHLCAHYIAEGKDEEEAQELVLGHIRDPRWRLEVAHNSRSQQEVADALLAFFEAHDPARRAEVDTLSVNYTGNEGELAPYLRAEYGPVPEAEAFDALAAHIDARKKRMDDRVRSSAALDNFLRRFFLRIEPGDGDERARRVEELSTEYAYHPERWHELLAILRERYPRALELNELQNMILSPSAAALAGQESAFLATTMTSATPPEVSLPAHAAPPPHARSHPAPRDSAVSARPDATPPASPPQPPSGPFGTRRQWLAVNAAIARKFRAAKRGNVCARLAVACAASVWFRVFFAVWLAAAALVLALLCVHLLTLLCWRLFVPPEYSFLKVIGYLCTVITLCFLIPSFLSVVAQSVLQWVFLSDEVLFADRDYAALWRASNVPAALRAHPSRVTGEGAPLLLEEPEMPAADWAGAKEVFYANPVPAHLAPTLPPATRATVWGLPVSKSVPAALYLGVLYHATVTVGPLYAIIRTVATGRTIYDALGYLVEYEVSAGIAVHVLLFVQAWVAALSVKYRAYLRYRATIDNSEAFAEFSKVLCMDESAVRSNAGLLVAGLAPILLVFWLTSRRSPTMTAAWAIVLLIAVLVLLIVRDVLRGAPGGSKRSAVLIVALLVVFWVFAIAGTASVSAAACALFITFFGLAQFLLLAETDAPDPLLSPAAFAALLAARLSERYPGAHPQPVPASTLRNAAFEIARDITSRRRLEATGNHPPGDAPLDTVSVHHRASDQTPFLHDPPPRPSNPDPPEGVSSRIARWLPCGRTVVALLSCGGRCVTAPAPGPPRPFWTLPEPFFGVPPAAPRDRAKQRLTGRSHLWTSLFFVFLSLVAFGVAAGWQQSAADAVQLTASNRSDYPACSFKWGRVGTPTAFTLADLAFVALTGYVDDPSEWTAGFEPVFTRAGFALVKPKGPAQELSEIFEGSFGEEETHMASRTGDQRVDWLHFSGDAAATHVVVVRSNLEGRHLMRDVDLWGDSILFSVISAVVPYVRFYSASETADWVQGFAAFKRVYDGDIDPGQYLVGLTDFVRSLGSNSTSSILLVGHGPNGAIASMAAAFLRSRSVQAVAFAPPGTAYLEKKMSLPGGSRNALAVVPIRRRHSMTTIDRQVCACRLDFSFCMRTLLCRKYLIGDCQLRNLKGKVWYSSACR
ncbi:hypothetical protein DIPPA_07528 [Diplonema papillatum]|nr:hypothetical protein DIPPA_07528 [Diplonema papillatum]